ncbi:MAG: co-chaperone GroES [Chloroflexi bacterium]|nr:co-chaperone GroES [Chloroflexota bacterium]MBU1749136.1 co-chaperone GroES [Chloroflexota bacterium]MBU1878059.1 co-chaperone GroES [Chloroflexota bacterium]
MALKLKPMYDRVLIKPLEKDEMTKGGILLPDTAKEKPQEGEIVAAGPGRLDDDGDPIALTVKVGDRVIYAKYAGTEIEIEGEDKKWLILKESDILAIVER